MIHQVGYINLISLLWNLSLSLSFSLSLSDEECWKVLHWSVFTWLSLPSCKHNTRPRYRGDPDIILTVTVSKQIIYPICWQLSYFQVVKRLNYTYLFTFSRLKS